MRAFLEISNIIIAADGGANFLYETFDNNEEELKHKYKPSYIIGDFDSLRKEVREYYEKLGT